MEEIILIDTSKSNLAEEELVNRAYSLFDEFYRNTLEYREKCKENEEYWKTNHWHKKNVKPDEPQPVTPVIFSTIENLLADIMDNFPEPVILAQEKNDDEIADALTDVVKFILEKRNFKHKFKQNKRSLLIKGASVTQVFWNKDLYNGLGDIDILNWDIKNFLWDTKVEDIQDGRACFKFSWYPLEYFKAYYPDKWEKFREEKYSKDTENKLTYDDKRNEYLLIEYWYKKWDEKKQKWNVHMAKLAGGVLLEWSEPLFPDGIYEHGKYPFIIDAIYKLEGEPVGFGIIDLFKNLQDYIDKLDQIIVKNALQSGKTRLLVSRSSGIDIDDIADWSKDVIEGDVITDNMVRWFQAAPLNPYVMQHMINKIDILKEESGQNQFTRGEGGKGITAASAILALQEAGSKRSRSIIYEIYEKYSDMIEMIIELIKQFYTESRTFRIRGANDKVIKFSNENLIKFVDNEGEILQKYIEFDIRVSAQKQSPYSRLYQNELAIQLRQLGILNEIELLEMLDFEGKDKVLDSVRQRLDIQAQMQQMQQMVAQMQNQYAAQIKTIQEQAQMKINELSNRLQKQNEYIKELENIVKGGVVNA